MKSWRLVWLGDKVADEVFDKVVMPALTEFGLRAETASKAKLKISLQDENKDWVKGGGRGKRQGTLQRSIHLAPPDYAWGGDADGDSELGGREVTPVKSGDRVTLSLGSGIEYAIYVHELHYNPEVNGFIIRSVEEEKAKLPSILDRYALGE